MAKTADFLVKTTDGNGQDVYVFCSAHHHFPQDNLLTDGENTLAALINQYPRVCAVALPEYAPGTGAAADKGWVEYARKVQVGP